MSCPKEKETLKDFSQETEIDISEIDIVIQ